MRSIKWISAVLALAMCLSLFAGCGKEDEPAGTTTAPAVTEPTTEPVADPTEPPVVDDPTEPPVVDDPVQNPTDPPVVDDPAQTPTDPPVVDDPVQNPTDPPVVDDPTQPPVDDPIQNPTEPPVVDDPNEELIPPVNPGQTSQGETVSMGDIAFYVGVPEGLLLDYVESTGLSMSNPEMTVSVVGTVYRDEGATLEEIVQTYAMLTELTLGVPVSWGTGDSIGEYQVVWYSAEGIFAYMTCIHNGDGYLLLEVIAPTDTEAYAYLQRVLAAVEVL